MARKKAAGTPGGGTETTQEALSLATVEVDTPEDQTAPENGLASVVEPSSELMVDYKPPVIISNVEGLRAWVAGQIAPFQGSTLDVSTKELMAEARKSLAELNGMGKSVDRERIDRVKTMKAPIDEFDASLKTVVAEIDTAYRGCKDQLDKAVDEIRKKKAAELAEEYAGIVGDEIAELIPYDRIEDKTWTAPTTTSKKASDALFDRAQGLVKDVQALASAKLDHRAQVVSMYYRTLDLRASLAEDAEITRREVEAAEQAKRTQEAFRVPPFDEVKQEPEPFVANCYITEDVYMWHLEIDFRGGKSLAQKLGKMLRELGISGGKIECKGEIK